MPDVSHPGLVLSPSDCVFSSTHGLWFLLSVSLCSFPRCIHFPVVCMYTPGFSHQLTITLPFLCQLVSLVTLAYTRVTCLFFFHPPATTLHYTFSHYFYLLAVTVKQDMADVLSHVALINLSEMTGKQRCAESSGGLSLWCANLSQDASPWGLGLNQDSSRWSLSLSQESILWGLSLSQDSSP